MTAGPAQVMFFDSAADFAAWLADNHATETEVWVGLRKKGSGRTSVTYAEAVEQGLRWGWIDSQARTLDETSYAQRFTPRRRGSNWSLANVEIARQLIADGRMEPAGLAAFEARRSE